MEFLWVSVANERDIELDTRREIAYFQATVYNVIPYINILLERRSDSIHLSKSERVAIHSWRKIERVTCEQLIGYLKHKWKIIIFHVAWYGS